MARKLTAQDIARGGRLTEIRDALGATQDAMVEKLNKAAGDLHLPQRYKYYTVSRMESGSISFEDAAVWLSLDPHKEAPRWEWFVLGPKRKLARQPGESDAKEQGGAKRRNGGRGG